MSTEEGRWDAHPCGEGACPCGLLYKLCVCTSLPHSGPMQVPTQVSRLATSAKASARVQKLAEPLVKELACCTRHNQPGFVISMVRQHHRDPAWMGLSAEERAQVLSHLWLSSSSPGCAALHEAGIAAS